MKPIRYVIITPVRNEQEHLPATIASIAAQTVPPTEWIVVDDGSTDQTGPILAAAVAKHPWLRVLTRADRGFRKPGTGVMEAFHDGFSRIATKDWEFLAKIDGDLSIEPDFFEKCFARFERNPRLGIGGGLVCNGIDGKLVLDSKDDPVFHVRGATKIYRRACWDAIGGLIRTTGWDTMDELKANSLGWKTYTFTEIPLVHHRETGGADGSWKNWVKNGRANYIVGYHPLFMAAKCARRVFRKPFFTASLGLGWGFLSGYLSAGINRVADPEVIRYLRSQQFLAIRGKSSLWRSYDTGDPAETSAADRIHDRS